MYTISLKINKTEKLVTVISFLHQETGESIFAIKENIHAGRYVITCPHYETEGLKRLTVIMERLKELDADPELYENDRLISEQILRNIINSQEETAREQEEEKKLRLVGKG